MPTGTDPSAHSVVLLSGATGAVGAAVARLLRARGVRLAVAVRRPWQVAPATQALGKQDVLVGHVPTHDGEAAAGFVKGAADALGPIDAFLCAAGAFRSQRIGKDPAGSLQELLDANLVAGANLARAVVGPMQRRRAGTLVFVGSAAVGEAGSGLVNYLASKAALHEYVRALHAELQGTGVHVCALLPTVIDTAASRAAMPDADRAHWLAPEFVAQAMIDCAFGPRSPGGPLLPLHADR